MSKPGLSPLLAWTRSSYVLLSTFLAVILLIILVWWPLVTDYFSTVDPSVPLWRQLDGLLLGLFALMSLLIMSGADLKKDAWIAFVGLFGGLVIESWGTQTHIWNYFTNERPPLWILPAWPIASLSIDRLVRLLRALPLPAAPKVDRALYWIVFAGFLALLGAFIWPFLTQSMTVLAVLVCLLVIALPVDYRLSLLTFAAGSALGYFLERWGTTRACWTYYTFQTPPVFAVFAHGLAAVAFWKASVVLKSALAQARRLRKPRPSAPVPGAE